MSRIPRHLPVHISHKLFQLTCWCFSFKVFDFRFSVGPRYPRTAPPLHLWDEPSLCLMATGTDTATKGKPESAHTQRFQSICPESTEYLEGLSICKSYSDVLVEACDGVLQMLHGNQHVLDHVVLFVKLPDGLSLCELQQRDLRRKPSIRKPSGRPDCYRMGWCPEENTEEITQTG